VLIAEATGNFGIKIVCQSIYGYCAAANVALLGGYGDWRIPYDLQLANLRDMEQPDAAPDAAAFPGWPSDYSWSSTTLSNSVGNAIFVNFLSGDMTYATKTGRYFIALVRGG
jgi:hypothetical protein